MPPAMQSDLVAKPHLSIGAPMAGVICIGSIVFVSCGWGGCSGWIVLALSFSRLISDSGSNFA